MAFFASRQIEPVPPSNGADHDPLGEASLRPTPDVSLPPFVEKALLKVAGTIIPQLQPLVVQAEQTMKELRAGMAELRAGQELLVIEIARLREDLKRVSISSKHSVDG